ncbi:MAG: hypothetical protein JWO05_3319 [Gemmatimonadetes bacterium]|nr:hypothetical protein [Gemmatimonadota bacterium]
MRARVRAWAIAVSCAVALPWGAAHAHDGRPLAPNDAWGAFTLQPLLLASMLLPLAIYLVGLVRLHRISTRAHSREVTCTLAGFATLFVALVSPLHRMGESLLSAHMIQHTLLLSVAAPLLVLGKPGVPMLWAFASRERRVAGRLMRMRAVRRPWRVVSTMSVATLVHAIAIWTWHAPRIYGLSLRDERWHALQHVAFAGTALLFWWAILQGRGAKRNSGVAVLCLFATAVHTGALGALMALSARVWYPHYEATSQLWGMTALEDQQLAGMIMWIPAGVVYVAAALTLMLRWLRSSDSGASLIGAGAP